MHFVDCLFVDDGPSEEQTLACWFSCSRWTAGRLRIAGLRFSRFDLIKYIVSVIYKVNKCSSDKRAENKNKSKRISLFLSNFESAAKWMLTLSKGDAKTIYISDLKENQVS